MKLALLLLPLIFFGCASMTKGKPLVQTDFQLQKAEQDAQFVKLQGENNLLKMQMNGLQKMFDEVKLEIKAIDLSKNTSAGRDIINDSVLISTIFKYWYLFLIAFLGAIGSLLGGVWGIVKFVMAMNERLLKAKDLWISNLIESNAKKEAILNEWQNEQIAKIINGKKEGENNAEN